MEKHQYDFEIKKHFRNNIKIKYPWIMRLCWWLEKKYPWLK